MPRAITSGELANLRKDGRRSKLFLAFHPYSTVFSCRVNQASFDAEEVTQVTYDGASGTYSDIKPGMTVWVGSSAGAYDLGMARIRKAATATVLYFGRGSEIAWEDNLYVTVVDDFDIWAKHWLVVGDAQVYMDQDIAYSDQNSSRNPVAVLGPDAVVELTGASVTHARDASQSWVIGSSISGYAWSVAGSGASVTDEATATPTFTFTAAGVKRISLTVTAANGKTTTVYRYVHVFTVASLPANEFSVRKISGELESGGWSFQVTMYGDANLSSVRDHAKCILFAQDWYGDTHTSIGEQTGAENIISWGWIDGESIIPNPETGGSVAFTVRGPSYWMQELSSFPGGLKAVSDTPSSWLYTQNLTVDVALWHLLYWRSTLMDVMDVILSGDDRTTSALTTYSDGFWEQLVEVSNKILARPSVTRLGRLYIQIDPQLVPVASRGSIPVVMEINKSDWISVEIERVTRTAINRMETSGVSSDGRPLFSRAVGKIITRFGRGGSTRDNLMLSDQDQLNTLTGLLYAKENNQFPHVDIRLAQNNRMIDIAGQQYVTISLVATDTPRGVVWSEKKLIPTRVEFEYDGENGVMSTSLECEADTDGPDGVTVIPPQPVEENIDPGVDPGDFPVFPPPNIWFPPIVPAYPPEDPLCLERGSNLYGMFFSPTYLESKVDEEVSTVAYFPCNIRSTGNFPTIFRLDARLYKWSTVYNSYELYVGFYDWFKVEAIDSGGSVIASASGVRQLDVDTVEFIFNVISNINIAGIKITIYADNDQSGADNYRLEDRISTGSLNVKSAEGILYNSLVVDQYYAARSIGGPYNTDPGVSPDMQKHSIEFNHTGNWDTSCGAWRLSSSDQWSSENRLGFAQLVKLIEVKYGLIIFKAVNSTISVRAYDINNWDDNIGSIGYSLYNVSYSEGSRFKMEISGAGIYNICPTL